MDNVDFVYRIVEDGWKEFFKGGGEIIVFDKLWFYNMIWEFINVNSGVFVDVFVVFNNNIFFEIVFSRECF